LKLSTAMECVCINGDCFFVIQKCEDIVLQASTPSHILCRSSARYQPLFHTVKTHVHCGLGKNGTKLCPIWLMCFDSTLSGEVIA